MSVAFREVHRDYGAGLTENPLPFESSPPARKHLISDNIFMHDKLLLSSDNQRPKSKSKTSLSNRDLQLLSIYDNQAACNTHLESLSTSILKVTSAEDKNKICGETIGSNSSKDTANSSNNAMDSVKLIENNAPGPKKGRKSRKRSNSSSKKSKGKHGRLVSMATGLPERRVSLMDKSANTSSQPARPSRVSSEPPPSKIVPSSVLTYTMQTNGEQHDTKKQFSLSSTACTSKELHNTSSINPSVLSCKSNIPVASSSNQHTHASTNHSDLTLVGNKPPELFALGNSLSLAPLAVQRLDINSRLKSASSVKSQSTAPTDSNTIVSTNTELSLTAVPCTLQLGSNNSSGTKPDKEPTLKYNNRGNKEILQPIQTSHTPGVSDPNDRLVNKENALTSIYGAVYQMADKVAAKVEEIKKVKKIYLSEKQSGTIRESGMEYPCAPPATPVPDVLKHHEYVPSMSDIRSQRAVKGRLQTLEKEAQKKSDKIREATCKMEKQQLREREKMHKIKQRREIYALNKVMTELENKKFLEFCQAKGLNKA